MNSRNLGVCIEFASKRPEPPVVQDSSSYRCNGCLRAHHTRSFVRDHICVTLDVFYVPSVTVVSALGNKHDQELT